MDSANAQKLEAMLRTLWRGNQAVLLERVELLRAAPRDELARSQAREAAHKLAGVLGTFGLPQGTELAREAEAILEQPIDAADCVALAAIADHLAAVIAAKSNEGVHPASPLP